MTDTPLWKTLLIWALCLLGLVFALPNAFYDRVERHNDAVAAIEKARGPEVGGVRPEGIATPEQAADRALWPDWAPSAIVPLGLDLRGGAHLLAEVKVADVYAARIDGMWPDVRDALRDLRDQVGNVRRQPSPDGVLRVAISNPAGLEAAVAKVRSLASPVTTLTGMGQNDIEVSTDNGEIVVQLSEAERVATDQRTLQQSLEIIRRRVDEVGTREPTIQRIGDDRILIQVPGIGSAAELKSLIGTTAKLTFNPVVRVTSDAGARPGPREALLPSQDDPNTYYIVEKTPVVTGEELTNAQPSFDDRSRPAVEFQFDPTGARKFGDYTANNIGKPFAIVLDDQVISAPVIQSHIPGGRGIITGQFSVEDSTELAVLLRAGALPAEMTFLEERTIGPELGADSVRAGQMAAVVAAGLVALYMIASYGLFGTFSVIALSINIALMFAIQSLIGATLTLPGIAGIVLTMGMAVDANVLIYERMREELRAGRSPRVAIHEGYDKALSAITDSNVTGMLTAMIMFFVGTGPVRGFAVTTAIGIVTSMFTAVYVTRAIISIYIGWRRPKTITV
ncbi:MAG TPA: protein translocase subunit SecD [Gemmobacter sp.]|nr:protein translocase subunit SecD [Gemmobacter sp.]